MAGAQESWTVVAQKLTLKVEFNGEVRRLRDWPEEEVETEPTIELVRSAVCGLFHFGPAQEKLVSLKYKDDEGDLCTLVEASLPDALSFAAETGVLRLTATCSRPSCEFFDLNESLPAAEIEAEIPEETAPSEAFDLTEQTEIEADMSEERAPSEAARSEAGSEDNEFSEVAPAEFEDESNASEAESSFEDVVNEAESSFEDAANEAESSVEDVAHEASSPISAEPQLQGSVYPVELPVENAAASGEVDQAEKENEDEEAMSDVSLSTAAEPQLEEAETPRVDEAAPALQAATHCQAAKPRRTANTPTLAEFADGVRRNASSQFKEAHRLAKQRIAAARPQISEEVAQFKQQLSEDFQNTAQDMNDAFGPREGQTYTLGNVREVVGATAGICAAARLAPVRATRLAAHSVAAVVGRDTASTDADEAQDTPDVVATAPSPDVVAVRESCLRQKSPWDNKVDERDSELSHLKQQVKNDFQSIRDEMKSAFGTFVPPQAGSRNRNDPTVAIPAAAASFIGMAVASWLVPLRVARFAVANVANATAAPRVEDVSSNQ